MVHCHYKQEKILIRNVATVIHYKCCRRYEEIEKLSCFQYLTQYINYLFTYNPRIEYYNRRS